MDKEFKIKSKLGQLSSVERSMIKLNPVLYEHIAPDSKIKFILFETYSVISLWSKTKMFS